MHPSSIIDIVRRLAEHLPSPEFILERLQNVPKVVIVVAAAFGWLGLVRALRWRRYHAIHRKYAARWDEGRGRITPEEAQEIVAVSFMYDMPLLLNYAVAFALFKTYGIPSISSLLISSRQFKENISRRYADTELLVATFFGCPISGFLDPTAKPDPDVPAEDPRANIALARINYLHSMHRISNNDFLYTLCLFAITPNMWSTRWGYRALSPLERHAYYTFWNEIGKRMGIKDIPDSFEGLVDWANEYEERHMFPAHSNHELAGYTLDELLCAVPDVLGLKSFATRVAICLMEDRVREAMILPEQPKFLKLLVSGLMMSVGCFQRWFLVPRKAYKYPVDISVYNGNETGGCPRLHPNKWAARPWYRPEPTNIHGWMREWLLVKVGWFVEMPGPHLKSTGYRIEEMGPPRFENGRRCHCFPLPKCIELAPGRVLVGHEEVMRQAAELQGRPVTGPWSLEGRR